MTMTLEEASRLLFTADVPYEPMRPAIERQAAEIYASPRRGNRTYQEVLENCRASVLERVFAARHGFIHTTRGDGWMVSPGDVMDPGTGTVFEIKSLADGVWFTFGPSQLFNFYQETREGLVDFLVLGKYYPIDDMPGYIRCQFNKVTPAESLFDLGPEPDLRTRVPHWSEWVDPCEPHGRYRKRELGVLKLNMNGNPNILTRREA